MSLLGLHTMSLTMHRAPRLEQDGLKPLAARLAQAAKTCESHTRESLNAQQILRSTQQIRNGEFCSPLLNQD